MRGTIVLDFMSQGVLAKTDLEEVSMLDKLAALMSFMQVMEFNAMDIAAAQAMITGYMESPVEIVVAGTGDQVIATQSYLRESWERSVEASKKVERITMVTGAVEDILNTLFPDREKGGNKNEG